MNSSSRCALWRKDFMAETRKLAAILAADVVGFSRLAGTDEDRTLARLRALRSDLIDPTVAVHNGRVVKRTGDGILVEFRSVVDAVRCAIELQNGMMERNAGLPPERRIEFRVGIHLGDVVEESDGDLMGDGVNIAARLEGVAKSGTICLSEDAYRQVRARLDLAVSDLGETQLKNIAEPIRIYSLQVGLPAEAKPAMPAERAAPSKPAAQLALPDKPSIVVLPFDNMSGDPEQEYFSDGISEDIITDLSKVSALFVIARNSAFAYKGKAFNIPDICRELGVRFALEGSVRKAGNRVRITAQLIDGSRGGHLWAERYDRDLTDIFAVQDDVTRHIVAALKVTLSEAEKSLIVDSGTTNVDAHDFFLKGRELLFVNKKETFDQSIACFRRAIELDPKYGAPYAGMAMAYIFDFQNHFTDTPEKSLDQADRLVRESITKDEKDPFAHWVAAVVATWKKDYDRWAYEADRALSLNPNFGLAVNSLGTVRLYMGEPVEAIPYIERAIRLDPAQQQYRHFLGTAYFVAGNYETAAAVFKDRIAMTPNTDLSRAFLASTLGHLGRPEEARRVWHELKEINPRYSYVDHIGRLPFKNSADADKFAEGLRKAGLAE
jgi:adenylate cyclase